jgi:predicted O-methyltransferase YrrM
VAREHCISPNDLADTPKLREWGKDLTVLKVEAERKRLLADHKSLLEIEGHAGPFDHQSINKAARGSKNYINCIRLAEVARLTKAQSVLELGTNFGISAAYLAIGAKLGTRVVTGDISGKRINVAKGVHTACGISNTSFVLGPFEETLDELITSASPIDLCFIDGDHTYEGTIHYFRKIRPHMRSRCVMIFDDVGWSEAMIQAWAEVSESPEFAQTFDIDGVGYGVLAS